MAGRALTAEGEEPRPAEAGPAAFIQVCRPLLPPAERLLPWLQRIDATRWYSNYGPLVLELEWRLARQFGQRRPVAVSAASGVAALQGAILAAAGRARPERPLALLPAYTFIGSAAAVVQCGYVPHIVDVDAEGWGLAPERLAAHPLLARAGLVMPVAPYGRAVPVAPWERFAARTGVPVVIDAAAAFAALCESPADTIGRVPVAVSFQATKVFSTGEGGAVVCSDAALLARVRRALNFGFEASRLCTTEGTNGKMSEYAAAVGLAELDGWEGKRASWARVASRYRAAAARRGLAGRFILAPEIGANYALLLAEDAAEAERVVVGLAQAAIAHRLWYGLGLHSQPALAEARRDPLPVTEALAPRLIGLPASVDLTEGEIERVVAAVAAALGAGG